MFHRRKVRRFFSIVGLVLLLYTLLCPIFVGTVVAISNPDSITIIKGKVFSGLWEESDWLVVAQYNVGYTVTPTEEPRDTFFAGLYSLGGTLVAVRSLNYYDNNLISIYFSSSDAFNLGLDIDEATDYRLTISGQPAYFPTLTDGLNRTHHFFTDADVFNNSITYNRELLAQFCTDVVALDLEVLGGVDLLTAAGRLNGAGSLLFITAIPGLDQIIPNSFENSLSVEEAPSRLALGYIYPGTDTAVGITSIRPGTPTTHFDKVKWIPTDASLFGTNSGTSTTIVTCAAYTEDEDYWVSATITITRTTDRAAPQGESRVVTAFDRSARQFTLDHALSATLNPGDIFSIDYSDTYVYTSSTSLQRDVYKLTSFEFESSSDLVDVAMHLQFGSSGTSTVYARPYLAVGSQTYVGKWHSDRYSSTKNYIVERLSPTTAWSTNDVAQMSIGVDVYSSDPSSSVRVYKLFAELVYTVTDFHGDGVIDFSENKGNRLSNALEGFGDWLGLPKTVVGGMGAGLVFFVLAGRIFVATGSTSASIALSLPFLILATLIGLLQPYLIFILAFVLIVLFGIVFILARLP